MKLFKKWGNDAVSFVAFLGKETKNQTRQMRNLYKNYIDKGDVDSLKKYTVQCGSAMQTSSLYTIAKYHFNLDSFKRKSKNHSQKIDPSTKKNYNIVISITDKETGDTLKGQIDTNLLQDLSNVKGVTSKDVIWDIVTPLLQTLQKHEQ